MNKRCPECSAIMMPVYVQHECTNRTCRTTLNARMAPGAMPRNEDGSLVLTAADVKHTIMALQHLNRRDSAGKSGVSPTQHGRAIASTLRKLQAYLVVLEEEPDRPVTAIERERQDIIDRLKAGELEEGEAQQLLAQLAEREEEAAS